MDKIFVRDFDPNNPSENNEIYEEQMRVANIKKMSMGRPPRLTDVFKYAFVKKNFRNETIDGYSTLEL